MGPHHLTFDNHEVRSHDPIAFRLFIIKEPMATVIENKQFLEVNTEKYVNLNTVTMLIKSKSNKTIEAFKLFRLMETSNENGFQKHDEQITKALYSHVNPYSVTEHRTLATPLKLCIGLRLVSAQRSHPMFTESWHN